MRKRPPTPRRQKIPAANPNHRNAVQMRTTRPNPALQCPFSVPKQARARKINRNPLQRRAQNAVFQNIIRNRLIRAKHPLRPAVRKIAAKIFRRQNLSFCLANQIRLLADEIPTQTMRAQIVQLPQKRRGNQTAKIRRVVCFNERLLRPEMQAILHMFADLRMVSATQKHRHVVHFRFLEFGTHLQNAIANSDCADEVAGAKRAVSVVQAQCLGVLKICVDVRKRLRRFGREVFNDMPFGGLNQHHGFHPQRRMRA